METLPGDKLTIVTSLGVDVFWFVILFVGWVRFAVFGALSNITDITPSQNNSSFVGRYYALINEHI